MSLLREIRENMRLARLNNPGLGILFKMLDFTTVLFKLLLLAAFGLGIWHIIYDLGASDAANRAKQYSNALEQPRATDTAGLPAADNAALSAPTVVDIDEPEVGALTPERIEMLRQFAAENRHTISEQAAVGSAGNRDTPPTRTGESMIAKVQMPAAIVDQNSTLESVDQSPEVIVAGDIVPLPVEQTLAVIAAPLELKSNNVLASLEKKLRLPLEIAGTDTVVESVGNLADQAVIASSVTEAGSDNTATTIVKDNGGVNENAWILAQDADRYTIQIGSTPNRPFLIRFARLLPKGEPVSIYYYVFGNRPEYGLSYGLFDSKAAANSALEGLSQKVRRYGAFARKLSIVHQQIEQLTDQISVARQ